MLQTFEENQEQQALVPSLSFFLNKAIYKNYPYKFQNLKRRQTANCVMYDMIFIVSMWRQARGYPKNGQTTYTNAKTARKSRLLFNFRLQQFFTLFGVRKRNIYPTLIMAEYNNRIWFHT